MTLQNHTILITGGSSGIGFELARQLSPSNKILVCGRTKEKLEKAKQALPDIDYLSCDISRPDECERLFNWVQEHYPECNMLINNAAIVHPGKFLQDEGMPEKAEHEIQTNVMAPIRLTHLFATVLRQNEYPTIINITTGLVYVPRALYPIYNATKAGLHAFTQVLRSQAEGSPLNTIEVFFPAVDTPWHKGDPPAIAITPEQAVNEMLSGIEQDKQEIRVGKVKLLYWLSRIAPNFAFKKLNSLS